MDGEDSSTIAAQTGFAMEPLEVGKYLIVDPRVCHGKLTFKGTRVPVQTVLTFLTMGGSFEYILTSWPYLNREAIEEAIRLAAAAWPELLRRPIEKKIKRLAEQGATRAKVVDEPNHCGRSS
jgi:uncharacterized protein (DUF433 family)